MGVASAGRNLAREEEGEPRRFVLEAKIGMPVQFAIAMLAD